MIDPDRERGPHLDLTFGTTNLGSDLEWVLQSSQVDTALVAEALLHFFYVPVVQIAHALEPGTEGETPFIVQVFVAALHQRYRFRSGMDATNWFYSVVVGCLPRTARQEAWPPLVAVLYAFTDLAPGQIAQLFKAQPRHVKSFLHQLEQSPVETLQQAGWNIDDDFARALQASWRGAFAQRFPAPTVDDDDMERLAGEVAQQAEQQGFLHNRLLTVRELVMIGLAILTVIGILLAANRLFPASEEENLPAEPGYVMDTRPAPEVASTDLMPRETFIVVTATPTRQPHWPTPSPVYPAQLPLPLSTQSNTISIRERLKMSPQLYHTVWADALLTFHSHSGADEFVQRLQFWISDNQLRLVSGSAGGELPQRLWIGKDRAIDVHDARNHNLLLSMGGLPSLKRISGEELRLLTDPLNPPLFDAGEEIPWEFNVIGTETVADRAAVIVDQVATGGQRAARLWLDRDTAFILRSQHYDPAHPQDLVLEIRVRDVRFDLDFTNQNLFDPSNTDLVVFSSGPFGMRSDTWPAASTPATTSLSLPASPAGFDPAAQALAFIYPPDFDLHEVEVPVEITAGGYSLGKVVFGNPWMMACTRSPDGRRIAFASHSLLSGGMMLSVGWFDLTRLGQSGLRILEGVIASQMAFSPTGDRLAVYGRGMQGRGVYITAVEGAGEYTFFALNELPLGLVWNPDGQYLAWVTDRRQNERQLTVVSFYGAQPVYQGEYTTEPIPLANSPLGEWQVPLPTPTGGLEDCTQPPID